MKKASFAGGFCFFAGRAFMNYIDIILILVVCLALWAGWQKGFILGTINLLVWVGSLAAGFLFYPYLAGWFQRVLPSIGVWTLPLSFLLVVIITRILLAMIFNALLRRTPEESHASGVNRFLGLIPGFINGLIYDTVIAALLLSTPLMNAGFSNATRQSRLVNELAMNVGWIDQKISPIFDEAVKKSLTGVTVEPESNETVKLNFTLSKATPRPDLEAEMLELVNRERTSRGLKALIADPPLVPVARAHDSDMFARGYFSHYTPEGQDPFDRMKAAGIKYMVAGENLALGQTLKICHEGLMNSPGHRANILNPSYGHLGIGILDGGSYGLMIAQEFRE
jgi:uncharacterized protein YkwD